MLLSDMPKEVLCVGTGVESLATRTKGHIAYFFINTDVRCMTHEEYHTDGICIAWDNGKHSNFSQCDYVYVKMENDQDSFFAAVEHVLGQKQLPGKTLGRGRWRRGAGYGRFDGVGIIRYFSPSNIHVSFHNPSLNKLFESDISALVEIKKLHDKD